MARRISRFAPTRTPAAASVCPRGTTDGTSATVTRECRRRGRLPRRRVHRQGKVEPTGFVHRLRQRVSRRPPSTPLALSAEHARPSVTGKARRRKARRIRRIRRAQVNDAEEAEVDEEANPIRERASCEVPVAPVAPVAADVPAVSVPDAFQLPADLLAELCARAPVSHGPSWVEIVLHGKEPPTEVPPAEPLVEVSADTDTYDIVSAEEVTPVVSSWWPVALW